MENAANLPYNDSSLNRADSEEKLPTRSSNADILNKFLEKDRTKNVTNVTEKNWQIDIEIIEEVLNDLSLDTLIENKKSHNTINHKDLKSHYETLKKITQGAQYSEFALVLLITFLNKMVDQSSTLSKTATQVSSAQKTPTAPATVQTSSIPTTIANEQTSAVATTTPKTKNQTASSTLQTPGTTVNEQTPPVATKIPDTKNETAPATNELPPVYIDDTAAQKKSDLISSTLQQLYDDKILGEKLISETERHLSDEDDVVRTTTTHAAVLRLLLLQLWQQSDHFSKQTVGLILDPVFRKVANYLTHYIVINTLTLQQIERNKIYQDFTKKISDITKQLNEQVKNLTKRITKFADNLPKESEQNSTKLEKLVTDFVEQTKKMTDKLEVFDKKLTYNNIFELRNYIVGSNEKMAFIKRPHWESFPAQDDIEASLKFLQKQCTNLETINKNICDLIEQGKGKDKKKNEKKEKTNEAFKELKKYTTAINEIYEKLKDPLQLLPKDKQTEFSDFVKAQCEKTEKAEKILFEKLKEDCAIGYLKEVDSRTGEAAMQALPLAIKDPILIEFMTILRHAYTKKSKTGIFIVQENSSENTKAISIKSLNQDEQKITISTPLGDIKQIGDLVEVESDIYQEKNKNLFYLKYEIPDKSPGKPKTILFISVEEIGNLASFTDLRYMGLYIGDYNGKKFNPTLHKEDKKSFENLQFVPAELRNSLDRLLCDPNFLQAFSENFVQDLKYNFRAHPELLNFLDAISKVQPENFDSEVRKNFTTDLTEQNKIIEVQLKSLRKFKKKCKDIDFSFTFIPTPIVEPKDQEKTNKEYEKINKKNLEDKQKHLKTIINEKLQAIKDYKKLFFYKEIQNLLKDIDNLKLTPKEIEKQFNDICDEKPINAELKLIADITELLKKFDSIPSREFGSELTQLLQKHIADELGPQLKEILKDNRFQAMLAKLPPLIDCNNSELIGTTIKEIFNDPFLNIFPRKFRGFFRAARKAINLLPNSVIAFGFNTLLNDPKKGPPLRSFLTENLPTQLQGFAKFENQALNANIFNLLNIDLARQLTPDRLRKHFNESLSAQSPFVTKLFATLSNAQYFLISLEKIQTAINTFPFKDPQFKKAVELTLENHQEQAKKAIKKLTSLENNTTGLDDFLHAEELNPISRFINEHAEVLLKYDLFVGSLLTERNFEDFDKEFLEFLTFYLGTCLSNPTQKASVHLTNNLDKSKDSISTKTLSPKEQFTQDMNLLKYHKINGRPYYHILLQFVLGLVDLPRLLEKLNSEKQQTKEKKQIKSKEWQNVFNGIKKKCIEEIQKLVKDPEKRKQQIIQTEKDPEQREQLIKEVEKEYKQRKQLITQALQIAICENDSKFTTEILRQSTPEENSKFLTEIPSKKSPEKLLVRATSTTKLAFKESATENPENSETSSVTNSTNICLFAAAFENKKGTVIFAIVEYFKDSPLLKEIFTQALPQIKVEELLSADFIKPPTPSSSSLSSAKTDSSGNSAEEARPRTPSKSSPTTPTKGASKFFSSLSKGKTLEPENSATNKGKKTAVEATDPLSESKTLGKTSAKTSTD